MVAKLRYGTITHNESIVNALVLFQDYRSQITKTLQRPWYNNGSDWSFFFQWLQWFHYVWSRLYSYCM